MTIELIETVAPPLDTVAPVASDAETRPRAWRSRRFGLALAGAILVAMLLWAFVPGLFTNADPLQTVPAQRLQAPSWAHPFGTDPLGRDQWARVVYGAANSMKATSIAVLIGMLAGTAIGIVAGFVGGWVDATLMRVVDVMLAIPGLLISLTIVTALGFGIVKVAIAVGIAAVAGFARVMRAEVLRVRGAAFVEAAVVAGVRPRTIALRTVMPHAIGSVLVLAALEFGTAILAVSALSFLGFGASPPQPEWGLLVADGRNYVATAWWLTALPGFVIAAAVVSTNVVSRHLKDWNRHR